MGHAFVPSKNDLRASTVDTLVKKVEEHKIYDEAHRVLDQLKQDIDEEQIMYKLVSMLLDQQDIKGPNTIGIPADRLDAILERAAKRGGGGGRGRGRGNYRGGNRNRSGGGGDRNRSGGGGGYRGNREGGGGDRNRSGGNRSGGRSSGGYRGNRD